MRVKSKEKRKEYLLKPLLASPMAKNKISLWHFVVATYLNVGDKNPPTMVSISECKRLVILRNYINTPSISTGNLKMSFKSLSNKPIESTIREKLSSNLNPAHLNVINESNMHNVPRGSETHFKVIVVSDKFENISLLQRHRMVNELLKYELENGVHALSIIAKTPNQWTEDSEVAPSPNCLGGKK